MQCEVAGWDWRAMMRVTEVGLSREESTFHIAHSIITATLHTCTYTHTHTHINTYTHAHTPPHAPSYVCLWMNAFHNNYVLEVQSHSWQLFGGLVSSVAWNMSNPPKTHPCLTQYMSSLAHLIDPAQHTTPSRPNKKIIFKLTDSAMFMVR